MRINMHIVLIAIFSLILIGTSSAFSQEASKTEVNPTAVSQEAVPEPETQWIWGEVTSVDAAKEEVVVKYLDYENDLEREITITVNGKTTYENLVSLDQLKPKDTVSIDYMVISDGINVAKNISVEKAEEALAPIESISPPSTDAGNNPQGTQAKVPATEELKDIKQ